MKGKMESIYAKVMGNDFQSLHPMLQDRYTITESQSFNGSGMMTEIKGGNLFSKLFFKFFLNKRKMFFSERGHDIPFKIHNTYLRRNEIGYVQWNRCFKFGNMKRYFNATMCLDEQSNEIVDYFGEPPLLVSTLSFHTTDNHIVIQSKKQWVLLFGKKIPLPKVFYGEAVIHEAYDEVRQCFLIHVKVRNPLLGELFCYKGFFTEDK